MSFNLKRTYNGSELMKNGKDEVFWKRIFSLPTEPMWYLANLSFNYAVIFYTLSVSVKTNCVDHVYPALDNIMYSLDVFYLVDIILNMITLYIPTLCLQDWNPTYRPIYILILELASLFPFKLILPLIEREHYQVYCMATLLRLLRLARVMYFHARFGRISLTYWLRIFEFLAKLGICILVSYSVLCNTICWSRTAKECDRFCPFWFTMVTILSKLTNYGLKRHVITEESFDYYWVTIVGSAHYFAFIFVGTVAVAHMTLGMKDASYFSYVYMNLFKSLYRARVNYNVSQRLLEKTYNFFKVGWTSYGGLDTGQEFYRVLTPAIASELMLDVCWPAFKHSNLFRSANIMYLRCLSLVMTQEFVMPGDYIYRKGDWKDKIMYLADGTIDILSEEDGESAILSLGSGTCLGETGIALSYPSVNCVRAKTFCEFHVLDKKAFLQTYKRHPDKWRKIVGDIKYRIEQAKNIHAISELVRRRAFAAERDIDTYTIFWLKNTLHRLMSTSAEMAFRHEFQNIYLVDEIDRRIFERLLFTASYLDMLAIKERVATDSDPVFVRTKFPFVLQPHSVITVVWELLIIVLTLVVIFLVPYASFLTLNYVPGYTAIVQFINLVFLADLIIQCCTAIKTTKVQYITCLAISIARLQDVLFWLDILSCLPLEMYTPAVLSAITPNKSAMLYLNKVIKIWRIDRLFSVWAKQFGVNELYVTEVKLVCTQVYLCYVVFALLVYFEGSREHTLHILFDVVQIVTAVGLVQVRVELYMFYLVAQFVAIMFKCIVVSKVSALFILGNVALLRIRNRAESLAALMRAHHLPGYYAGRLKNNYECDWDFDFGRGSHRRSKRIADLLTVNYGEVVDDIIGSIVKSMEFFRYLPTATHTDLVRRMAFVTRPANETIVYNGDITSEIQIFYRGSLDVLDADGAVASTISTPQPLNIVEVLLDLPSMRTCVTRTTCSFARIDRNELNRFFLKYADVRALIDDVRLSLTRERALAIEAFDRKEIGGVTPAEIYKNVGRGSLHLFEYQLKSDSFEEWDYYLPFDRLYPFDWVRYFLLRFTILPAGNFIYGWEGLRALVAILSAIVHFVGPLAEKKYDPLFYGIYAYSAVDIYVRFHVCYYDEKGILIKHPLKTAKHYVTHGLLMDFLAFLPVRIRINDSDYLSFFIGNTIRLLPLGRYLQYLRILNSSIVKSESKLIAILYAPLIIVIINYVGSFLINFQCKFGPSARPDPNFEGFSCGETSLLAESYFHKPISAIRAHLYGVYFASSFLLLYGFRGYTMVGHGTRLAASILSFVGQGLMFAIMAKLLYMYSHRKSFLSEQQAGMGRLKKFMRSINVSKRLAKIVVDSYEVKWKITRGRTINSAMGEFATPLRRDLYYEMYGSRLVASSVFRRMSPVFYRNVLDSLTYQVVPKGGYLSTINDIEDTTYILFSGIADILLPDGSRLATITDGAMFGNLENRVHVRIGTSIIAMSHVEMFAIKSTIFYRILAHYPPILEEYRALLQIYFTYIPSRQHGLASSEYLTEGDLAHSEGIDLCQAWSPHGLKIKAWTLLVIAYTCYFSILIDLYHMASGDFSISILTLMYSSDLLYAFYFLTLDRLAYEDSRGYLVTDLVKIKKKLRENRLRIWISIASLFPTDIIISATIINQKIRGELYPCSRLNRALRLIHVIDYFSSNINKVNVRFVVFKTAAIVCWTVLFLFGFAALLTVVACRHEINMNPPVPDCKAIDEMSSSEKLVFFINQIYFAIHILTVTASSVYYPHAPAIIVLFVCSFVVGAILQALVFAQVFALYNDLSIQKKAFKRRLDSLSYFMNREDVSFSLMTRIKKHMQLVWMTTSGEVYPNLLKRAPLYLKGAIMNNAFGHLIFNHPVFSKCHPDCLRQIVQELQVNYFFADDYVQFKGSVDETAYFIFTGIITVLRDDHAKKRDTVAVLQSGDGFGLKQGLLRRTPHLYSYRCKRYSIVVRLHLDSWEYLLKFFPATKLEIYEELEKYMGF